MKVIDIITNSNKPLFTFEILPPLKGHDIQSLYENIERLIEFNPAYINITYHQREAVFKQREDGLLEKKIVCKRPGTVALSTAIQYKFQIPVVTHIICGGFTQAEIEDVLIDLNFLGINNILALRGDPPKSERIFVPEKDGHAHTSELIEQIVNLNHGKYLDQELENKAATDFCIGVAGYPEKHFESPNIITDIKYLKLKVEKGAKYIVTQMFFDNKKFFDFVELCRNEGITVPIIPGIKPISILNDVKLIPQLFHIDIPDELISEINKCKNNIEAKQVGIEWTINQSKELIKSGISGIHYYTYGHSDNIKQIVENVF